MSDERCNGYLCYDGFRLHCNGCADGRARIATLEAENARLRADLARVTGERDDERVMAESIVENYRRTGTELDAARRSLEEAVRLLREADQTDGCRECAPCRDVWAKARAFLEAHK